MKKSLFTRGYKNKLKKEVKGMKKELKIVKEQDVLGKQFRIYGDFENPLFLAKDVAEFIDYAKTGNGAYDVSRMVGTVDEEEKLIRTLFLSGQRREVTMLTEDGLYEVLMQSRKPIAKQFKKKVKEILKEIRKKGIYATEDVTDRILNDPDFGIALLTQLKEERNKRKKAEKTNAILMHVNKTYTMTEIAKELNLKSAIELNKMLSDMKIQYKINNTWVFYANYSNRGYEEIKQEVLDTGKVIYHRRITQLGREFILGLFDVEV